MSQSEIKALEDRRFAAFVAADRAALEELLADDLVYTHSNASVDSKASLIESILTRRPYVKVTRHDETIHVYGDAAVVTGRAEIDLVGPRKLNSRYIDVWVKGAKGWQMAGWQSTPIPAS